MRLLRAGTGEASHVGGIHVESETIVFDAQSACVDCRKEESLSLFEEAR